MKFCILSLLALSIVVLGITEQAYGCNDNSEKYLRLPNYADIKKPKRVLHVPHAHGICVAENGNFAVTPWNTAGKFYLYDSCGNLLKEIHFPSDSGYASDCAFVKNNLYVADQGHKRLYKYTADGLFAGVVATGEHFARFTTCNDHLYVSISRSDVIVYKDDKEKHRINMRGSPRGMVVDSNGKLNVGIWAKTISQYSTGPEGKCLGSKTYDNIGGIDGMAIDGAGNILIADRTSSRLQVMNTSPPTASSSAQQSRVFVYSPGGMLIKTITGFVGALDVDVGVDGTVMVADYVTNKVYMY